MSWVVHPEVAGELELNGTRLRITADDLVALAGVLALPVGTSSHEPGVLRTLFEHAFASPIEFGPQGDVSYWTRRFARLKLSPFLRIQVRFQTDEVEIDGEDAVVGIFRHPHLSVVAQAMSRIARSTLDRVALLCAASRRPFPYRRAFEIIRDSARRWFEEHQEYETSMTEARLQELVGDSVAFHQNSQWHAVITLTLDTVRREVVLPIDAVAAFGSAFDAVNRGAAADFEESVRRPTTRHLLRVIDELGGFASEIEPRFFPPQDAAVDAFAVTTMGHAFLIIDGGRTRILVDPWFHPWDDTFERQPLTAMQLGPVDAICITHFHDDHMNPESLFFLPKDVPVFVPPSDSHPFAPRHVEFLRLFGFNDIRELGTGDRATVGGIAIEALPFFGEARDRLGFAANCYGLTCAGRRMVVLADSSPDSRGESIVTSGALEAFVALGGPAQVVFGTWWQERTFACLTSTFAMICHVSEAEWLHSTEISECTPEYIAAVVETAQPSLFVTYAENDNQPFKRWGDQSTYLESSSASWIPWKEFKETARASGADLVRAAPYRRVRIDSRTGAVRVDDTLAVAASGRPGTQPRTDALDA